MGELFCQPPATVNKWELTDVFRRKKRSVSELGLTSQDEETDLLTVLDAVELSNTLEDFLGSIGVESRQCKMRAVCEMYHQRDEAGKVESVEEMVRMVVEMLNRKPENNEAGSVGHDWIEAAKTGLAGQKCDQFYSECSDLDFKENLLQLSF